VKQHAAPASLTDLAKAPPMLGVVVKLISLVS